MIKTETVEIDGRTFTHTWSDEGFLIVKTDDEDTNEYADAYDPADLGRVYVETDKPIPSYASDDELAQAARIMLGLE